MTGTARDIYVESVRLADLFWLTARHRAEEGGVRLLALYSVSKPALFAARLLRRLGLPLRLEELDFDYVDDVVLPDGTAGKDELLFNACPSMVQTAEADPAYEEALSRAFRTPAHDRRLRAYLSKRIFMELSRNDCPQPRSVTIAAWHRNATGAAGKGLLYAGAQWCNGWVAGYAARWGIELRSLPARGLLRRKLAGALKRRLRPFLRRLQRRKPGELNLDPVPGAPVPPFRIAADCYRQGITRDPLYNTEWFWYRESVLPPGAVFGYFHHPEDVLSDARRDWLRDAGIGWLDEQAFRRLKLTPLDEAQDPERRWRPRRGSGGAQAETVAEALEQFLEDFYDEYCQWYRFFRATNTRIHLSAFDMFAESEALHAALADLGGVSISLQRSIEADPNLRRRTVTDVHFGFSYAQADWERESGSTVGQFVTAGYPFDDAFPAARAYGREIAGKLHGRGARFIVCFLDQNLGVHPKWLGGQRMLLNDYSFLCDRLEEDPSLGLVLKPKSSRTLPQRLGPVWPRLQRLIDSGRCVMLHARSVDQTYLPCVAACAADVAINWIIGGTAGIESALAGTRTLLIRQHFRQGEFREKLEGAVSFQDWPSLWRAVEALRADPADPDIGNWGPLMEQYASLRDGQASRRMQDYIRWLYQGLAAGLSKESALAEAGRRYAQAWGAGSLQTVSAGPAHAPQTGFLQETAS